jgi:NADPH:quinone reductase-like Zn-dependent oxidoreductase
MRRLLLAAGGESGWAGVVHLWSLDVCSEPATADALRADVAMACGSVLHLVQGLAGGPAGRALPGLTLITRGAAAADAAAPVVAAQSPLSGLSRVIAQEHPEFRAIHVDLDQAGGSGEVEALRAEILTPDGEDEIALRGGVRLAGRVRRSRPAAESRPADAAPVRLEIPAPGELDRLALRPAARRAPAPGEVEIRVHAAGLNFRDVLCALDMYPGEPGPLGVECAGEIAAVGEGVATFREGDPVMALAPGSFATFVTADARLVAPWPAGTSAAEAATIPSAFLTAWYALRELGRLRAGERVLIHAAAGGVGLAALQVARRAGAEVLATAGSPEKRDYLRGLGLAHVMDSRSLEFAREVQEVTGGQGVEVVVNSLTGEAIAAGLCLLAPGGRFLELGRRDVWDAARVRALRPDVAYLPFNLLEILRRDGDLGARLLRALLAAFADGSLRPLPRRDFPLAEAVAAFRHMAQARHIGKIVLTLPPAPAGGPIRWRRDGTYLVTGGLSGLGLAVAAWLAERGAGHLVLVGRREPDAGAREAIARLEAAGTRVVVAQADVSQAAELESVLARARQRLPPLRGVLHLAGTLSDGVVLQQTWERFAAVLAPKLQGAWNLHRLTRQDPLDVFVCFSSAVSLLGRAGQANHAAACAFEDALAHARRRQGLPGLSVNWGPWGGGGAATRGGVADRIAAEGFFPLPPDEALGALERLLASGRAQTAVMDVDWERYAAAGGGRESRRLLRLREAARRPAPGAAAAGPVPSLHERLAQAPAARRPALLLALVREQAVKVLGLEPSRAIDPRLPLHGLGLDSLMAVELRNALGRALGRGLPATLLFDYPSLDALAGYLGPLLGLGNEAEPAASPPGVEPAAETDIGRLSEAQAETLLLTELDAGKASD